MPVQDGWEPFPGGVRLRVGGTIVAMLTTNAIALETGKTLDAPAIKTNRGNVAAGTQVSKIADPAAGGTTDTELRAAAASVIDALEAFGISAT